MTVTVMMSEIKYDPLLRSLKKQYPGRLNIIKGNQSYIDFGVKGEDYNFLLKDIDYVLAAHRLLQSDMEDFYKSETREIVEFGLASEKKVKIIYFSPITVSGNSEGIYCEKDLYEGQKLESDIDRGCMYAERILDKFKEQIRSVVIRTSIPLSDQEDFFPFIEYLISRSERFFRHHQKPVIFTKVELVEAFLKAAVVNDKLDFSANTSRTFHLYNVSELKSGQLAKKATESASKMISPFFDIKKAAKIYLEQGDYEINDLNIDKLLTLFDYENGVISNLWSNNYLSSIFDKKEAVFLDNKFNWNGMIESAIEKLTEFRHDGRI